MRRLLVILARSSHQVIIGHSLLSLYHNPVKCHYHEHEQVQEAVEYHYEKTHLNFLEEAVPRLHIYVYQSRALHCNKLLLLAKHAQLTSLIQFKVISCASENLH